ncbi:hypothetical protein LC76P1_00033 [Lysinibacillus phage LC76P1]|nr:hypothetical protein LC76P1_00033 [Lysinibacillus phage LC76P1]
MLHKILQALDRDLVYYAGEDVYILRIVDVDLYRDLVTATLYDGVSWDAAVSYTIKEMNEILSGIK